MSNIFTTPFGGANGREARLFQIGNEHITACVTDFGAALARLYARTGEGIWRGIALGYENASGYLRGSSSVGATVGRYAGRIGGAAFTLGGRSYELERNDGNNHLHGGFGKRFWDESFFGRNNGTSSTCNLKKLFSQQTQNNSFISIPF